MPAWGDDATRGDFRTEAWHAAACHPMLGAFRERSGVMPMANRRVVFGFVVALVVAILAAAARRSRRP